MAPHNPRGIQGVEMSKLDLTPFLARGFGAKEDTFIANIQVEGIDKYHTYSQIRLAPETSEYLYKEYTPVTAKYYKGSRPMLEKILNSLQLEKLNSNKEKVTAILKWTAVNIKHAIYVGTETPGNRALSEEELINSGWGWCNEKARIFVSMAQMAGFPARMCSLFHQDKTHGHMTSEVYFDGRWAFTDPTSATVIVSPATGDWADARTLSWDKSLHDEIDKTYLKNIKAMSELHGTGKEFNGSIWYNDNPYKMFYQIGITNYPIMTFPCGTTIA